MDVQEIGTFGSTEEHDRSLLRLRDDLTNKISASDHPAKEEKLMGKRITFLVW
jgi:hypothetical protein